MAHHRSRVPLLFRPLTTGCLTARSSWSTVLTDTASARRIDTVIDFE